MAKQTINIGASPNDGTGTPLRTAFDYTNQNFTELYTATGPSGNNIIVPGNATITGDLTVDTNVLKVDTTLNRVGIGTATLFGDLNIQNGSNCRFEVTSQAGGTTIENLNNARNAYLNMTMFADAYIWNRLGTTAMTLNATGLGVGNAPVAALDVYKVANDTINRTNATFCFGQIAGLGAALLGQQSASAPYQFNLQAANAANSVQFPLVLQPSGGNVGIGVTPSAWATYKAVSVGGIGASVFGLGTSQAGIAQGAFFNNGAGSGWAYSATSQVPTYYLQINGENIWNIAASGTAGAQITAWTPAMKLDASGRLLVGSISAFTDLTGSKEVKIGDSGIQAFTVASLPAATATNIARGGVGGLVYVGGFNGTGQYGAVVLWTAASATVVSVINGTGSTITFGVAGGFLQITSSLVLTQVTASCIRI